MKSTGKVVGVNGTVLNVAFEGAVHQNEVALVVHGGARLKAEVVRVRGKVADLQLFEDPRGLAVGDEVEFTGELLAVELGPGLLGQLYDGLQNPLHRLAEEHGFFLKRGAWLSGLEGETRWSFEPVAKAGDTVRAGDSLGTVPEGVITHRVMVPFHLPGSLRVESVAGAGDYHVRETIAVLVSEEGEKHEVAMSFNWPVRRAVQCYAERLPPTEPLATQIRIVDSMFPVAKGGTYCIPGPFGAGKTVLQQITSRFARVDVVIVAACGERAGEVVETIRDFPRLTDPVSGRPLLERTIIICNTSSMPVASREASVYTAVTLAEYYRQMGLDVLLLADSTSRWAQAMRERSGRLEEIPGEEAFPAYLESTIAGFYERAGRVRLHDGRTGSVTIGGTVSPAGGNFEEPVTQATLKVVGAFHALSQDRAEARHYPAIDPLESWSRYQGVIAQQRSDRVKRLLSRAHEIGQMMKVVGEEGTSVADYVLFLKGRFFDDVYLQQNAFDVVDAATDSERQEKVFGLLEAILDADLKVADRAEARRFFNGLRQRVLDLNGVAMDSPDFERLWGEILDEVNLEQGGEEDSFHHRPSFLESELDSDVRRARQMRMSHRSDIQLDAEDETDYNTD